MIETSLIATNRPLVPTLTYRTSQGGEDRKTRSPESAQGLLESSLFLRNKGKEEEEQGALEV